MTEQEFRTGAAVAQDGTVDPVTAVAAPESQRAWDPVPAALSGFPSPAPAAPASQVELDAFKAEVSYRLSQIVGALLAHADGKARAEVESILARDLFDE